MNIISSISNKLKLGERARGDLMMLKVFLVNNVYVCTLNDAFFLVSALNGLDFLLNFGPICWHNKVIESNNQFNCNLNGPFIISIKIFQIEF